MSSSEVSLESVSGFEDYKFGNVSDSVAKSVEYSFKMLNGKCTPPKLFLSLVSSFVVRHCWNTATFPGTSMMALRKWCASGKISCYGGEITTDPEQIIGRGLAITAVLGPRERGEYT